MKYINLPSSTPTNLPNQPEFALTTPIFLPTALQPSPDCETRPGIVA